MSRVGYIVGFGDFRCPTCEENNKLHCNQSHNVLLVDSHDRELLHRNIISIHTIIVNMIILLYSLRVHFDEMECSPDQSKSQSDTH